VGCYNTPTGCLNTLMGCFNTRVGWDNTLIPEKNMRFRKKNSDSGNEKGAKTPLLVFILYLFNHNFNSDEKYNRL
jgi:hypothetical protein